MCTSVSLGTIPDHGNYIARYMNSAFSKKRGQRQPSSVPVTSLYLCRFSSAVPVQVVPSMFHDGEAYVAARISAIRLPSSGGSVDLLDETPLVPAPAV